MTTPTGQISITDVRNEFGRAAPDGDTSGTAVSLGKYRVNDDATFNKPLDVGVPQSGTIKMSDLRGKTRNVIFNYSGTIQRQDLPLTDSSALNVSSVYNANVDQYQTLSISKPLTIGQFIERPSDTASASNPVILTVLVTGKLGSKRTDYDNSENQYVALDTGTLGTGVSMRIEVATTGKIFGAGGQGGKGSKGAGNGGPATNGTTAIGVRSGNGSVTIINSGTIQCGFGGGGGGGGSYDNPSKSMTDPVTSGGGGGGGAGFPNGLGGDGGTDAQKGSNGGAGNNSTDTTFGAGGDGGSPNEGVAIGGDGGDGGQNGIAPEVGFSTDKGSERNGSGGAAGINGAAIRQQSGGAAFTLVGSVIGSTNEDDYTFNG